MARERIRVTKNFDLSKIKLDLTRELNLAAQIVKKDHFQRLERGIGVSGKKLEPSQKIKLGLGGKTLVDSGQMRNLVIDKATKSKQVASLAPGSKRSYRGKDVTPADVGYFHQTGAGRLPKREWFGITDKAEKDIFKMVEMTIEREIRNA